MLLTQQSPLRNREASPFDSLLCSEFVCEAVDLFGLLPIRRVMTRRYHVEFAGSRIFPRLEGNMAQSQPRAIAYNGGAPGYGDGRDEDYSPPNENSRAGRAEKKPRKRNSVAVSTS